MHLRGGDGSSEDDEGGDDGSDGEESQDSQDVVDQVGYHEDTEPQGPEVTSINAVQDQADEGDPIHLEMGLGEDTDVKVGQIDEITDDGEVWVDFGSRSRTLLTDRMLREGGYHLPEEDVVAERV